MNHKFPFFNAERRGYHHGRLKDALIESARALISERGLGGFTLAEAAKRAGVTAAAPYRHFADRNDLMGELARRGFELFDARLLGAWDGGRPEARVALERMGRAYLAFAFAEPGLYVAMFNSPGRHGELPTSSAAHRAFEGLSHAVGTVLGPSGGVNGEARRLAFEIWSLAHGVAMLALAGHFDRARGDDPEAMLAHGSEALIEKALRRPAHP
jgi:AcrR family transcriptional regulator